MGKPRVLVVEDALDLRRVVRAYLETALRCEVQEAADGIEALERLSSGTFDLVLSDLLMPRMTGLELLSVIRRNPSTAGLPVILLTAQEEESERSKALALGVNDYLLKPFSPQALRPVVERLLPRPEDR